MTSKDHEMASGHHTRMGNFHGAALKKCKDMEDSDGEAFHKAAMVEHASEAARHLSCCKSTQALELSKASMGGDPDAIRPDGISSIIGEAPAVTPIFRTGQRQFGKAGDVDPQLEKILGTDE